MSDAPIRVLLVDDEEGFTEVLAKRLRRRGFSAVVALTGAEALAAVASQPFDVAVVDYRLSDADGLTLLPRLQEVQPGLAALMLTGHGSEEAARESLAAGAAGHLVKPCEIEELAAAIRAVAPASAPSPRSDLHA